MDMAICMAICMTIVWIFTRCVFII